MTIRPFFSRAAYDRRPPRRVVGAAPFGADLSPRLAYRAVECTWRFGSRIGARQCLRAGWIRSPALSRRLSPSTRWRVDPFDRDAHVSTRAGARAAFKRAHT